MTMLPNKKKIEYYFHRFKWKWKSYVTYPFRAINNYFLVKRYPFLKPQCGYGTDMEYHRKGYRYHYEETWLDCLPKAWRKAFGINLCEDLKREIYNSNLADYKVVQVKEKFGDLCWYDEGGNNYTNEIIRKYEELSESICQKCGKPAEYVTFGWVGFYCKKCIDKMGPNIKYNELFKKRKTYED